MTLAAIAWQESHLGKYLVALKEGSVGIHHINIESAIKRSGLKDNDFNRAYIATEIIKDPVLSSEYAIKELKYWKAQGRNWRQMVMSYNSGWDINHGQAKRYLSLIREKVETLSQCEHVWLKPYL
ncbi:transglycosylase SLT domain-containing protein [Vibrio sp. D431a]|uniref:transglycosylase SLT domain-containing protein n=1 Tax=Vibrio sp. D431a TaxID=2837388 RepID=UPI0025571D0F|nr:transglycosylase SLT domain-containing protein [Vibrio sp. D431a]MDK9793248.1 transglycosylase SLT domain-containing protein [Vibrio sp. D431a]